MWNPKLTMPQSFCDNASSRVPVCNTTPMVNITQGSTLGCACFHTCDRYNARRFHESIPAVIESTDSPWYAYLVAVYGTVPLPFALANLSFFYHNDKRWRTHHPHVPWPMSSCRLKPFPNLVATVTQAFVGFAKTNQRHRQGAEAILDGPLTSVQCSTDTCLPWLACTRKPCIVHRYKSAAALGRHAVGIVHYASDGSSSEFGGSTRGSNIAYANRSPASPSNSYVEVARTHVSSEGTSGYGCWFHFAPGSGVWLNVGRTIVVPNKLVAMGMSCSSCSGRECASRLVPSWLHMYAGLPMEELRLTHDASTDYTARVRKRPAPSDPRLWSEDYFLHWLGNQTKTSVRWVDGSMPSEYSMEKWIRDNHFNTFFTDMAPSCHFAIFTKAMQALGFVGGHEKFPFAAWRLGYDSVQLLAQNEGGLLTPQSRDTAELILTTSGCMAKAGHCVFDGHRPTAYMAGLTEAGDKPCNRCADSSSKCSFRSFGGPCVYGLRAGWAASQPCRCNTRSPVLRCEYQRQHKQQDM